MVKIMFSVYHMLSYQTLYYHYFIIITFQIMKLFSPLQPISFFFLNIRFQIYNMRFFFPAKRQHFD